MNTYIAGQVVEFTALFEDGSSNPADPTTVAFKYRIGGNPTITLNYAGATTPAVNVVARTATGSYKAQIDTTNLAASWTYEWIAAGAGQTVGGGTIDVDPAPL